MLSISMTEWVVNSGLWLFTRAQLATEQDLREMHALLKASGVATSRLHKVEQANCTYDGAYRK